MTFHRRRSLEALTNLVLETFGRRFRRGRRPAPNDFVRASYNPLTVCSVMLIWPWTIWAASFSAKGAMILKWSCPGTLKK